MLTGTTCRTRALTDACGRPHTITVLRPDATPENRSALLDTERQWRAELKLQPPEQWQRAQFALQTAFFSAHGLGFRRDVHIILAAQDGKGAVRGLTVFMFRDDGTWEIALHTVDPNDQGGAVHECQLRGVGSELLGAAAEFMSARACSRIDLDPLDDKASAFWQKRGFIPHGPGKPYTLSCQGMQLLATTYAHSPHDDEDMLVSKRHDSAGIYAWGPSAPKRPRRADVVERDRIARQSADEAWIRAAGFPPPRKP